MTATPFATVAQILATVKRNVTGDTRDLAAQAIEMHTGLIEAVDRPDISDRDRYWLMLATSYQAVWLMSQPDYLERLAVGTVTQDGHSATPGNPDWLTLAPAARKCLKRLNWRGVRTVQTAGVRRMVPNINSDEYEETLDWQPV